MCGKRERERKRKERGFIVEETQRLLFSLFYVIFDKGIYILIVKFELNSCKIVQACCFRQKFHDSLSGGMVEVAFVIDNYTKYFEIK